MNFNEKLLSLRKAAGISQDTLAQQLGVSRQAVSKWELGTAMPETENIIKISQIFDVTTDYLLGYTVVEYPDIKSQLKDNADTVVLTIYTILSVLLVCCVMKSAIHLAREIIWTIRPLASISYSEWKIIAAGLGLGNRSKSILFTILSAILYITKLMIKNFYKRGQK